MAYHNEDWKRQPIKVESYLTESDEPTRRYAARVMYQWVENPADPLLHATQPYYGSTREEAVLNARNVFTAKNQKSLAAHDTIQYIDWNYVVPEGEVK